MKTMNRFGIYMTLLVLALTGCCRQARYEVVVPTQGRLAARNSNVLIEPVRFDQLLVEGIPEAYWLASHSPRDQRLFAENKYVLMSVYRERLAALCEARGLRVVDQPEEDTLVIRAHARELTPGFWAFIGSDAMGRLQVDFADPTDATPRAAISVTDRVKAEMWTASSEIRVRKLAAAMAEQTMKYLAKNLI